MKILLVDDDALDLFIARTLLQTEFEVEGFTSLSECVAWASHNDFDAVLIDYYFDTGIYAHHILAALQKVKSSPIRNAFVLSSFVDSNQLKELRRSGFDDVIHKPVSLNVVRTKLGVTPLG